MATTKNITMKQFNGNDYDTLYPQTQGSQIIGSVPIVSGGTGGINATSGMYNLLNGMSTIAPATNDLFPFKDVSGSTSGLVTLTNLITAMGNNGVITTSNLSTQASNLGFSKIQTGSYVGTGTYGESSPCSLTFDFAPKLVLVSSYDGYYNNSSRGFWAIQPSNNATVAISQSNVGDLFWQHITWNNNTISWYARNSSSASGDMQFNGKNVVYYYISIG